MKNPRVTAVICLVGVGFALWPILFPGPEQPGTMVTVLNWVLLAGTVIGLIGSLVQMGKGSQR